MDLRETIQNVIDQEINPMLNLHKGAIQLVDLDGNDVSIRFNGGCVGCPSSKMTLLNFIEPILKSKVSEDLTVIPVE